MSSYFPCRIGRTLWLGFFVGAALLPAMLMAADRADKAPSPIQRPGDRHVRGNSQRRFGGSAHT